ncbi:MAG: DNA gyrase subunit A [Prevotella pectinovora]|uniref:DNA gyrase subunit A n=1 Tax=Prevotella pectinovora TaxID=1602169 RepID=A0A0D0I8G4_9BACT|nr:DNA gyrase subunit A [Prevotella pectinovora]KIP57186.1 DNA gyrase subunit A [Prevotella pectinovora]KIP59152.1 DNA gyrase subunit A [Prevotella pectinovora]KIP64531.1 DNA gyrase subunit A [Prevotella pectinovora]KIP64881.1 DNA gyrase subunit A [Prevotella pectinovora]MCI6047734.1 DNA gyrase subunit A [Prevotella pectinovora]
MDSNNTIDQDRILKINIEEEMKSSYIDYSMSVIVARALPDVRDGFKPVHRRILYGMMGIGNTSDKPYKKCARVVGEVLGKYHPHGDSSVYGALVRMAQDWNMRYTLVDGQGNFGSVDGDSAAAMRYTECRLSKMGEHIMDDLNKDTVDMTNNFDDSLVEPTVMPTKIPNLLVNGGNGIAVGMATNIPTHNLGEVIDGCCAYIDNPEIDVDGLMRYIKAPDFPTGAYIYGIQGVKDAYETGRGRIVMRAKAEIESGDSHDKIVITEIPYGVNKAQLITYIADLVKEGKLDGISNANDESGRQGMRIVIDVKKDANANVILNKLFKMTALQSSFSVNCIALVKGRPRLLTLKECVHHFVEHRHDVTIRRTKFDLKKAQERAHILEGLIIACDNIDEVVHIIRASKTPSDAQRNLEKRFELDELQSKAIVDMRLSQLTGLRLEQLHAEYEELERQINYLQSILNDPELCKKVMKDELQEVKEKYGDERRTEIKYSSEEFNPEDFYPNDPVVITISHLGYIKRTPLSEFREQSRGGVGSKGAHSREQDFTEFIYPATMHNTMMFFTKKGRCYWLKCYEIPEGNKSSKGRAIQNLLNIESDDSVNAFLRLRGLDNEEFINSHYVVFATKNGLIKKTLLEAYSRPRANGVIAINIQEGDEVVGVRLTNGHNELVLANRNGRAVRFDENAVRAMGRVSTGVRGMRLDGGDDEVVGMVVVNKPDEETIMVVSENGYGKRSLVEDYRVTNRGGKGVKTLGITEKTGRLVAIKVVTDENDLMIINKSGIVIRLSVKECRVMGRATQGVRLINLTKKNDVIASVCKVMSSELEAVVEDESRKQMVATNERINQDSTSAPATQFEDGDHIEESDSVADNNDVNNE